MPISWSKQGPWPANPLVAEASFANNMETGVEQLVSETSTLDASVTTLQTGKAHKGAALTPYDFGGNPADADSTTAVQAMIDAVKGSYDTAVGGFRNVADLAGEIWRVSTINATGVRQTYMTIRNGHLYGITAGKVVLDLSGTARAEIYDLRVSGNATSPPAVGMLLSRADDGTGAFPGAPHHKIVGLQVDGYFSKAGVINFASEVSTWVDVIVSNKHRNVNAAAFVLTGNAQTLVDFFGGVTSEFVTIPTAAAGSQSCILHDLGHLSALRPSDVTLTITNVSKANPAVVTVNAADLAASALANGDVVFFDAIAGMTQLNGNFYTVANLNAALGTFELSGLNSTTFGTFTSGTVRNRTGPAMILSDCVGVSCRSSYLLTYGRSPVILDCTVGDPTKVLTAIDLEIKPESTPPWAVDFKMPTTGTVTIHGLKVNTMSMNHLLGDSWLRITGTGTSTLVVENLDLEIPRLEGTPAGLVFGGSAQSRWQLKNANIRIPQAAAMNTVTNLAGFTGKWFASDTNAGHIYGHTVH